MPKLTAVVRVCSGLLASEIGGMYTLFAQYYDSTTPTMFQADLSEKSHVILLHSGTRLCGFSTLLLIEPLEENSGCASPYRVLFSGDTIIDRNYWGDQALAMEFCHFAGRIKAQKPTVPLYWLLISKGYRTYRYLHLFSKSYWPSFRSKSDQHLEPILIAIANRKFGSDFDPSSGLIRFAYSRGHLRQDWAAVREDLQNRAEIRFFLQRNPRYALGEELACITLLDESNLRSIARRAFANGFDLMKSYSEQTNAR
jgi:hypothetical protein